MSVSNGLAVMSVKTRQLSPQRWGKLVTSLLVAALLLQLTACGDESPRVLGTVERDRLTLTAPVGELINRINVVEGQQVQAGEVLLELDSTAAKARLGQRQAELKQAQAKLEEAVTGSRRRGARTSRRRGRRERPALRPGHRPGRPRAHRASAAHAPGALPAVPQGHGRGGADRQPPACGRGAQVDAPPLRLNGQPG